MSGKSQTIGGFYFLPTVPDISDNRDKSDSDSPDEFGNLRNRGTGAQQFRGVVMSEIHRQRLQRYKFEFSFVGNDRRPSQKSGTRWESRNTPDSPDLSPSILDDRAYLRSISSFH